MCLVVRIARFCCLITSAALAFNCVAQGAVPFELAISPSRHVIAASPGESIARAVTLNNLSSRKAEYVARTLDWSMTSSGGADYHDKLLPGSCRPWISIERKLVSVDAGQQRVYRFQIDIPKDAPRGECRFMVAFEGAMAAAQTVTKSAVGELRTPVMARIAIPVYVAIGKAEPVLELLGTTTSVVNGVRTPVLRITNTGDAHGRLEGGIDAVDGDGNEFVLVAEESPILPGQSREIPLTPQAARGQRAPVVKLPIKASGALDWDKGTFKIDTKFE